MDLEKVSKIGGLVLVVITVIATLGFSKPWVNFKLDSVRYDGHSYSYLELKNSSKNFNKHVNIKIPFSEKSTDTLQIIPTRGATYTIDNKSITITMGKGDGFELACKDCNIEDSSLINLDSDKFALRNCSEKKSMCLYSNKTLSYLTQGCIALMVLVVLYPFLFNKARIVFN